MRPRIDPSTSLLDLAAQQAGVLSAEQALGDGLPRAGIKRLVDQGAWQRLTRGVFLLGVGEPSWLAQAWAGALIGGDRSRLGFTAAGHLWGIVDDAPRAIPVLVPWSTVIDPRGSWTFPRERPGVRQSRSPGDPPRTTLEDTVVDLSADADTDELAGLIATAIRTRRTTARELLTCVDQRARLANRALLRSILHDVSEGAESPLEIRYLHDVERRHQLPRAQRQHRAARRGAVRDIRYDQYGVLIELDGRTHVAGRFRDLRRDNRALLDGEVTLRYGWDDVTGRPCQVAWQVAELLCRRGWSGVPTRCSWCSAASLEELVGA